MRLVTLLALFAAALTSRAREHSFDADWEFRLEGDRVWHSVELPHDWAIAGPSLTNVCARQGDLPFVGKGYYRKRFRVEVPEGGRAHLEIGMALPNSLHYRDVKKFRDCGMTVFRCAMPTGLIHWAIAISTTRKAFPLRLSVRTTGED